MNDNKILLLAGLTVKDMPEYARVLEERYGTKVTTLNFTATTDKKLLERIDAFMGVREKREETDMRVLFSLDMKNYGPDDPRFVRPSVRGIVIENGKIAMVHSLKYDYYKFPGGGIDDGESHEETLIREVREEAGLKVKPETIHPYGRAYRAEKSVYNDVLVQDNYYYLCEVEKERISQDLDDYEADESFTLEWVQPETAISANRKPDHGPKSPIMIEREAKVLEMLVEEGYFK